ncbi:hypothetical protein [Sporolactobacillus sp. KGMB 08714]|uniref:hypothetical protein n=1 Tax=Sporolactobacillus sp. KGMB 08714 TaxID=3064704 RepID=UPI002FBE86AD
MQVDQIFQNYLQYSEIFRNTLDVNWKFVCVEDAGSEWKKTRQFVCHCGKVLRYRYTLAYVGPMDSCKCILMPEEKAEINRQHGKLYLGETCFGHRLLGLSGEQSDLLTRTVRNARRQSERFGDEELYQSALKNQKHLIHTLEHGGMEIPEDIQKFNAANLPLNTQQRKLLKELFAEYERNYYFKRSSRITEPNLTTDHSVPVERGQALSPSPEQKEMPMLPRSIFGSDFEAAETLYRLFDEIQRGQESSALDLAFEIDQLCTRHYGYFSSSGRPRLYSELILFLLEQRDSGQVVFTDYGTDDIFFVKT